MLHCTSGSLVIEDGLPVSLDGASPFERLLTINVTNVWSQRALVPHLHVSEGQTLHDQQHDAKVPTHSMGTNDL